MIGLTGIAVLLCLYYYLIHCYHRWWRAVPGFDCLTTGVLPVSEKISVIVAARNEEAVIDRCVRSLLRQSYPRALTEILIVDDHSTDSTAGIVKRYAGQGVRLISLSEEKSAGQQIVAYKKKAIETAIKLATGTLIVTTDADCTFQENWIQCIAAFHRQHRKALIAGPVKMKPENTLLSAFQCIDFSILQGITAASVSRKFHNMCNGANLAYEKSAFEEVGGFEHIDHIASGDDILLMQKIKKKFPDGIAYMLSEEAIVETLPASNWRAFFQQRIRWASKTGQYEDKRIVFVLLLVYLLNLSLVILLAGSIWYAHWLLYFGIAVILKTLIEWRFVRSVLKYFRLDKLMHWFPLFQPMHIFYTVIAGFFSSFARYEWKGRTLR